MPLRTSCSSLNSKVLRRENSSLRLCSLFIATFALARAVGEALDLVAQFGDGAAEGADEIGLGRGAIRGDRRNLLPEIDVEIAQPGFELRETSLILLLDFTEEQ